jgi:DNA-cytosine methyltransferase
MGKKTGGTNIERRKCQITFGSDFSGLDTGFIVAKKILARVGRRAENVFTCDSALVCKKIMAHTCPAKVHYDDICKRDTTSMEPVDVFMFTPPCGSFSAAGLKDGVEAQQGRLLFASLDYIRVHKPRAIVMENSPLLVGKFKYDLACLLAMLKKFKYSVSFKILKTNDFGIPQTRKRLYVVGVLQQFERKNAKWWPEPYPSCVGIGKLIKVLPPEEWKPYPTCEKARQNVETAYTKVVQQGINPWKSWVIVDAKSSHRFMGFQVGQSPTLCRARCSQMGYWCSKKGGYLNVTDMMLLQGFAVEDMDFTAANVTPGAFAGCLGNALSANVMAALLPHVFHAAKLISPEEFLTLVS